MQDIELNNTEKKPRKVTPVSAWEQALRYLDKRWYSEKKLREKLFARGYPVPEIDETIEQCRRYNLINDEQLAGEFARSQTLRGRGARRIKGELFRHGLTGDAAVQALEAIAPLEPEAAQTALQGKLAGWSRETDWRKRREKAFRFLAGRGFAFDIVLAALDAEPSLNYGYDGDSEELEPIEEYIPEPPSEE